MPSSIAATANSSASWSLVVSKQYQRRTTPASTEASACPTGYHLAFDAGSIEELHATRSELIAKGIKVTPMVDHDWISSIYFKDPNGLLLEYAAQTRAPADPQVSAGRRITATLRRPSRITDFRDS